jgi:hypothetical protein
MMIGLMFFDCILVDGRSLFVGLVKTDLNWFNNTNKWTNYRTFQKECKRHLRKAEWDYVNTNIIDGLNKNTKPFWKYVKSKHQESGGIAPLKKRTNLISDSKGKTVI